MRQIPQLKIKGKMANKIDQVEIDRATVAYYKSGKKVKRIKSLHFDIIEIQGALHIDVWGPKCDPYEREQS